MEITHKNANFFKNVFSIMNELVSETEIIVDKKEGLLMKAMDDGRICIISIRIDPKDFTTFNCKSKSTIKVSVDDLKKILDQCTTKQELYLSYDPKEEGNKLNIIIKNTDSKSKGRRYKLNLSSDVNTYQKSEKLITAINTRLEEEGTSIIKINPLLLESSIKAADIISEELNITIKDDGDAKALIFSSEGQLGELEDNIDLSDLEEGSALKDAVNTNYAISYLSKIIKTKSVAEKLSIKIRDQTPMIFTFTVAGNPNSEILYLLAPRIEEEEEDKPNGEENAPSNDEDKPAKE